MASKFQLVQLISSKSFLSLPASVYSSPARRMRRPGKCRKHAFKSLARNRCFESEAIPFQGSARPCSWPSYRNWLVGFSQICPRSQPFKTGWLRHLHRLQLLSFNTIIRGELFRIPLSMYLLQFVSVLYLAQLWALDLQRCGKTQNDRKNCFNGMAETPGTGLACTY